MCSSDLAAEAVNELSPVKAIKKFYNDTKNKLEQLTGKRLTPEEVRSFQEPEAAEPSLPAGGDDTPGTLRARPLRREPAEKEPEKTRLLRGIENMQLQINELQKRPGQSIPPQGSLGLRGAAGLADKQVFTKQGGLAAAKIGRAHV